MPYSPAKYQAEKALGTRASSGASHLKQLSPIHYTIIAFHLEGKSNNAIALLVKKSYITITKVLNDPLAMDIIEQAYQGNDKRFRALYGKAVDTIDESMEKSQPMNIRLRGADTYLKAHGKFDKDDGTAGESAEDVIARILQMNIQVNVNTKDNEESHILIQSK